jgi:hypothetical protein
VAERPRGYRKLAGLPAWGLYAADGKLVASVRAFDAMEARDLFKRAGESGERVKRIDG